MKIVFFLLPLWGHIYPNLELIKKLNAQNELLCVADEKFHKEFSTSNVPVIYYPENVNHLFSSDMPFEDNIIQSKRLYFSNDYNYRTIKNNADMLIQTVLKVFEHLWDIIQDFNPGLILGDTFAKWTPLFARKLNIPYINIESATIINDEVLIPYYKAYLHDVVEPETNLMLDTETIINQQKKIDSKTNRTLDMALNLHADDSPKFKTAAYMCPELQLGSNQLLPEYCYVGFNTETPDSLKKDKIFVTRGTITDSVNLDVMRSVLRSLSGKNYDVIATLGNLQKGKSVSEHFGGLGKNIALFDHLKQIDMLAQSKIMVGHGGITGVREAILSKTSMIIFPLSFHCYQVGRSVEENHAGILLKEHPFSEKEFLTSIEKITNNDSYTAGVMKLRENLIKQYEADNIYDIITEFTKY